MLLKKLFMYPDDSFYEGDDESNIEGMEPVEVDGEEVLPPIMQMEMLDRYCFKLKSENSPMPF